VAEIGHPDDIPVVWLEAEIASAKMWLYWSFVFEHLS